MSWYVMLYAGEECVKVESHEEGGTYVLGGTDVADLNVTYNYSWFYYRFLDAEDGLYWLNGKKAKDTIERLEKAVEELGTDQYQNDYWAPTHGNAGHALNILLVWAKQHPDAMWEVC
jgi:hypothetical protein